jgi:hypothetical protein
MSNIQELNLGKPIGNTSGEYRQGAGVSEGVGQPPHLDAQVLI